MSQQERRMKRHEKEQDRKLKEAEKKHDKAIEEEMKARELYGFGSEAHKKAKEKRENSFNNLYLRWRLGSLM